MPALLIAYAFDMTTDAFLHTIGAAVNRAAPNPQARLDAFIEASFSPLLLDRNVLGVWVVFWDLILHSRRMARAQARANMRRTPRDCSETCSAPWLRLKPSRSGISGWPRLALPHCWTDFGLPGASIRHRFDPSRAYRCAECGSKACGAAPTPDAWRDGT